MTGLEEKIAYLYEPKIPQSRLSCESSSEFDAADGNTPSFYTVTSALICVPGIRKGGEASSSTRVCQNLAGHLDGGRRDT